MLHSRSSSKTGQAAAENDSEKALVRRAAAGDHAAFREIVSSYRNAVFTLVLRQVGSHCVAEELAQEIFVKAYLHMNTFRFESRFSTWLTRIALNHTNSYFASRRYKQSSRTEEFKPEIHAEGGESPEALMERKERMARFRAGLAALSPKLRDALTLCALEGRSYEEAAEVMKVPVGTVRSRLNKARLQLKEIVGGDEKGGGHVR